MTEPVTESEPTRTALAEQVQQAEAEIRKVVTANDSSPQTPGEIQTAARNGWSASVMAIAFWSLVNRRVLKVDENLHVRQPD